MIDEPAKRMIDHAATGGTILTTAAYYAEHLTHVVTLITAILAAAWYVYRFWREAKGKKASDDE